MLDTATQITVTQIDDITDPRRLSSYKEESEIAAADDFTWEEAEALRFCHVRVKQDVIHCNHLLPKGLTGQITTAFGPFTDELGNPTTLSFVMVRWCEPVISITCPPGTPGHRNFLSQFRRSEFRQALEIIAH